MTEKSRVLSGMRPTGNLHLGNYLGALDNWVRLQDDYECFFFVASWHALTTDAKDCARLRACGDLQRFVTVERLHFYFSAERGLAKRDWD